MASILEEIKTGIFDLGGGNLYDADEDVIINSIETIKGGKYKNPIDKAFEDEKKEEKNKKWLIEEGPKEMAKLVKKKLHLDNVIAKLNKDLVVNGIKYNLNYDNALGIISTYDPYLKAADKLGIKNLVNLSVGNQSINAYDYYLNRNNNRFNVVNNPYNLLPASENLEQLLLQYQPNVNNNLPPLPPNNNLPPLPPNNNLPPLPPMPVNIPPPPPGYNKSNQLENIKKRLQITNIIPNFDDIVNDLSNIEINEILIKSINKKKALEEEFKITDVIEKELENRLSVNENLSNKSNKSILTNITNRISGKSKKKNKLIDNKTIINDDTINKYKLKPIRGTVIAVDGQAINSKQQPLFYLPPGRKKLNENYVPYIVSTDYKTTDIKDLMGAKKNDNEDDFVNFKIRNEPIYVKNVLYTNKNDNIYLRDEEGRLITSDEGEPIKIKNIVGEGYVKSIEQLKNLRKKKRYNIYI